MHAGIRGACHAEACRRSGNVQHYKKRAQVNAAKQITVSSNVASQRPTRISATTAAKASQPAVEDMLLRARERRGASAQHTGHNRVSISRMTTYWMAAESCAVS